MKLLLLGNIGGTEILLIVLLVLLLFGGKKIPELMRGVGKGVKSFRDGMEGKSEPTDEKNEEK
ncbi:MAG: twin-arginine translocase TatA/TatE family subunit [Alistipes sp.]|jgi:sec-independent protein translocase protein TatA|nr:twin-arginine translocase TatA/TatE family subunit [Alistipes sp.]MBQ6584262.1 twin-arginine translocase TatA/TatE family subunit [Alistipes sp.]MEE0916048.1 twin-arginine translocase TatA/TatE family subunit [Alistipes sp.]